jgi:hypothetical protein
MEKKIDVCTPAERALIEAAVKGLLCTESVNVQRERMGEERFQQAVSLYRDSVGIDQQLNLLMKEFGPFVMNQAAMDKQEIGHNRPATAETP